MLIIQSARFKNFYKEKNYELLRHLVKYFCERKYDVFFWILFYVGAICFMWVHTE